MSLSISSVLGNECATFVSVTTAVVQAVGVFSKHWSDFYRLNKKVDHHREVGHEGLWITCVRNHTSNKQDCTLIETPQDWLLSVQVLTIICFGLVLVCTALKLMYHFRTDCNTYGIAHVLVFMSCANSFLLMLAVLLYSCDVPAFQSLPKTKHVYQTHLSWGFTFEVIAAALSGLSGICGLFELRVQTHRDYLNINEETRLL